MSDDAIVNVESGKASRRSGKALTTEQKTTLAKLQARKKKTILIPEDPMNPDDLVVPVAVNGVIYTIPRGKEYDVPDTIYNIWKESYEKTLAARRRIVVREDRNLVVR
ncbi:hypothetical protein [Paenibacillus koleovorans]|uniref:hypothetical protein n=1 Tax=Paenibacillus koleovorans TaxID=121608 RepID=UPI000FDAACBB|nr:hypothetical protein [Paenibacillus koleovorans]